MATCPKCDKHTFQMEETTVAQCDYTLVMVKCSNCGTVVGVMDRYNIGTQNEEIKGVLQTIAKDVKQNQYILGQIADALNRMIKQNNQ